MITLFAFSSFLSNVDKEVLSNMFSSVNMIEEDTKEEFVDSISELSKKIMLQKE